MRTFERTTFVQWVDVQGAGDDVEQAGAERNVSVREAIWALVKRDKISGETAKELDAVRFLRNVIVHEPGKANPAAVQSWLSRLHMLRDRVLRDLRSQR